MSSDDLFDDQATNRAVSLFVTFDEILKLRADVEKFGNKFEDFQVKTEAFGKAMIGHMTSLAHEMRLLKDDNKDQLVESRISNRRMGKNLYPLSVILIITMVYGIAFIGFVFGKRDIEIGAPGGWHFSSKTQQEER